MTIEFEPLTPKFGARVLGVDMTSELDDETFAVVRKAFTDYGLLYFGDQSLSVPNQVSFARRFGEVQIHVMNQYLTAGHPEVYFLSNLDDNGKPNGKHPDRGTMYWHVDGSWRDRPGQATIMVAEIIPNEGGETHFCCTQYGYEALDAETKEKIANLRVQHNLAFSRARRHGEDPMTEEQKKEAPPVIHPLVRTHPESGRKSIMLGDHAECIEGMDYKEGRQLIEDLNQRIVRSETLYEHKYKPGDIVIWDNRRSMHKSTPYNTSTERRVMRRSTVLGEAPEA